MGLLSSQTVSRPVGFVSALDYGVVADGTTDDRAAIQTAIAAAYALNAILELPPATMKLTWAGSGSHSLILQSLKGFKMRGTKGKTYLKHADNVANASAGSCQMLRVTDCEQCTIEGIGFDGNWGNAYTTVTYQSDLKNLASLPDGSSLYVDDTSEFPSSGSFTLVTYDGPQVLTYSSKSATALIGVSVGTGRVQKYDKVCLIDKQQKTTEVAAPSDGADLPVGTIDVASTTGFPASASAGLVRILTTNGWEEIQYTSKNATQFLGVTGGTGIINTGNGVQYVDGGGNQATLMQVDPKNHAIFVYGSDGNFETPNRDIVIKDCVFRDMYGDNVWIGAWSYDTKVIDCQGVTSGRNGITLSSFADGVEIVGCSFDNIFTTSLDSEPVDAGTTNVKIDRSHFGIWFNPWHSTANIAMSIQGGVVGRPAEWNYARHWRVSNSTFDGSVLISDARDVAFKHNEIRLDFDSTAFGPVVIEMFCNEVSVDDSNWIWSRASGLSLNSKGLINITRYQMGVNTAAQPGNIYVGNNQLHPRNGLMGIYNEATGGYGSFAETATSYTAPTGPNVNGEIGVSGTPWTGLDDYFLGHQVLMAGKIANIVGNDSNTLFIAPLYENYASGLAWHDANGRAVIDPSPGAFVILPTGGQVTIERNSIDCRNTDGAGAGAEGVYIATDTTWDPGFNHMRVKVANNDVRGATGAAYRFASYLFTDTPKWKELHVIGNHAWDDQETPTCTAAMLWENPDLVEQKFIFGNTKSDTIPVLHSGLTSGSWRTNGDYPEEWAGYEDPNELITAPPASTYRRLNSNTIYVKESPADTNTGWVALKGSLRANIRDIGTQHSGAGALDMTGKMPASVDGDIELLFINTNHGGAAGSDATLSTPARFEKKVSATSNYSSNTLVNRAAIWWRRKRAGDVAPVVADSGDFNEAIVVAYKDIVQYGDPFDFAPVATTNTALSTAVTATGGTTATDGTLFGVFLSWFNGGATITVSDWANADTDLTEEYEAFDRGVIIGSDRIGVALFTGRTETAAAIGDTTATINAESYALWTSIAFGLKPAQNPARAIGTITCTTKANYADTDYMTIGDGMVPAKRYEFDTAGDGDGDGIAVNISGATTAADVAAILRTAILANHPSLDVTDNADGTLTVRHNWPGAGGNVAMTENVTNAGHTVSGLSGGQG